MDMLCKSVQKLVAANDDPEAEIFPGHLAIRRMERRVMLGVAVLAVCLLSQMMLAGHRILAFKPDLVSFAFRI